MFRPLPSHPLIDQHMRTDDKRADSEYLASLRCMTRLDYNTSLHSGNVSAYTHQAVEMGKGQTAQSGLPREHCGTALLLLSLDALKPYASSWACSSTSTFVQRSMSVPPHVDPGGTVASRPAMRDREGKARAI